MSEWQPIETAPKDEWIILFFPANKNLREMVRVDVYPVTFPRQPTHWMPLPAPPEAK
jgi:hypothetical protein